MKSQGALPPYAAMNCLVYWKLYSCTCCPRRHRLQPEQGRQGEGGRENSETTRWEATGKGTQCCYTRWQSLAVAGGDAACACCLCCLPVLQPWLQAHLRMEKAPLNIW